jgi:hypothetical protein
LIVKIDQMLADLWFSDFDGFENGVFEMISNWEVLEKFHLRQLVRAILRENIGDVVELCGMFGELLRRFFVEDFVNRSVENLEEY